MPTTFKNLIRVQVIFRTDPEDLIPCPLCGDALPGSTIRLDCEICGATGYSNYWSSVTVPASFRSGAIGRFDQNLGSIVYYGECAIKLDYKYRDLFNSSSYVRMDGIDWKYHIVRTPGEAMGQKRLVLSLTRK